MKKIDVVTVYHRDTNKRLADILEKNLYKHLPEDSFTFTAVDNTSINRGFAKGCNYGATHNSNEILGFINPDAHVHGNFYDAVVTKLDGDVVITGHRYDKPGLELKAWGVKNWVCGSSFFVTREFFNEVGGFNEDLFLFFDETDMIREAEFRGYKVVDQIIPIHHASPEDDTEEDRDLKNYWMNESAKRFYEKWNNRR